MITFVLFFILLESVEVLLPGNPDTCERLILHLIVPLFGPDVEHHADHSIPGTIDEWLDQFEMFSIYEVLPEILELWGTNLITDVESKKNLQRVAGK